VELDKLRELIQIFEQSKISEMELEDGGTRIVLKKAQAVSQVIPHAPVVSPPVYVEPPSAPRVETALPKVSSSAPVSEPAEGDAADDLEGLVTINAPMVGVFYAAPAPGEPPFVRVGDRVEADQTVCIVEAMKLMNEVTAKFPCIIEKILVENAEPVEFGQPLFAVRPVEEE